MSRQSSNNPDYLKPEILNKFIEILEMNEGKRLFKKIKYFHPSEIASYIQILNDNHRKKLIKILSTDFDTRILVELESNFLMKIVDEIDLDIFLKAIKELDSDEAAAIIEVLDYGKRKELFSNITKKDRELIEENLSYAENTAGRLMQSEIVKIPNDQNVGEVIDYLREERKLPKAIF